MKKFIIGTTLSLVIAASAGLGANVQADTVYRLYNRNTGEHFYTKNTYERSSLIQNGWKYGSVSFYVSSPGGNTPPPTQAVWQGWVKNGAGAVVASQNFSDAKSATTWASKWADEHYYSLIVNGKLGSFGANQIS